MRWKGFRCLVVAAAILGFLAYSAQGQGADVAARRVEHLRRGINTGQWFAQSPKNYGVERLRSFTTLDDVALIHRLGFDHIRLSIDPDPLVEWQQGGDSGRAFVAELDHVVAKAMAERLAVIVDVHPESAFKHRLLAGDEPVQQFAALWKALATHFKDSDPEMVFFEIMNEPEQTDAHRWQGIEDVVARGIREVAPRHTIIATGARWSGLEDLLAVEPIGVDNIIYTFHDYEPFAFTHQGAGWTLAAVKPLRGVPYPSSPEAVARNLDQETTLTGRYFVEQYGLARWDAERVERTVAFAAGWSKEHHVPVYCGEFGVYRTYSNPEDRTRWLRDMRVALEKHHVGWAMWDYQEGFGVVTKANAKAVPDAKVLDALGLVAK